MHKSALIYGGKFFDVYLSDGVDSCLDLGAADINGSLRALRPKTARYIGCDQSAGKGVDVVVAPGGSLPFRDGVFDSAVSSSVLEHDERFWDTVPEVARTLREGGVLYLNAPSDGEFHRYPQDCWRFYPDAGRALERLACRSGWPSTLVEAFWGQQDRSGFTDCVMVFTRGEQRAPATQRRIWKEVPGAWNITDGQATEVVNPRRLTSDRLRLRYHQRRARRGLTGDSTPAPGRQKAASSPGASTDRTPDRTPDRATDSATGNDRWPVQLPHNREPRCSFDHASMTQSLRLRPGR